MSLGWEEWKGANNNNIHLKHSLYAVSSSSPFIISARHAANSGHSTLVMKILMSEDDDDGDDDDGDDNDESLVAVVPCHCHPGRAHWWFRELCLRQDSDQLAWTPGATPADNCDDDDDDGNDDDNICGKDYSCQGCCLPVWRCDHPHCSQSH